MIIRTYSELKSLKTFDERYEYLRLYGDVGKETFGCDRIFNQRFYTSREWARIRNFVITRDLGCDLGLSGYEIKGSPIYIHHMNPITLKDIQDRTDYLLDPEYLITTCSVTHRAIHYGQDNLFSRTVVERFKNDTCPWKK